jgi:hypothetical protein
VIARLAALCLLLSACWFEKQLPDIPDDKHKGGSLHLDACGYDVVTVEGASAPLLGQARLGADPSAHALHLGLASDAKTSIVISWETGDDTLASTVQYGKGGATDQTLEGVTFVYDVPNLPTVRIHEAHLCGLSPDTQYSYRVGGLNTGGGEVWSEVASFRTAPSDPNQEVVLLVLGDTRDGYTTWGNSLQQAFAIAQPDLILFSGDGVTLGPVQPEWDTWFANAAPYLKQVPLISAHGNHDANAVNYYSQFALPGDEQNFGLDYGPVHITVANDTPQDPSTVPGPIAQFLQQDLTAAADAPWRMVLHHRPLWSSSSGHGGDMQLRAQWGPIFDMARPDLVLNGHDHDYERTKPLRAGMVQSDPAAGTVYVVAGSAGAVLYDSGSDFYTEKSEKTNSFVIVHARKGLLKYDAYRPDGSALDSFMLAK